MLAHVDPSPPQDSVLRRHYETLLRMQAPQDSILRRHYETMLRLQGASRSPAARVAPRPAPPQAAARPQDPSPPQGAPERAEPAGGWLRRLLSRVFG